MKVLFVSNDPTIFDEGSASRARMRTYAAEIGELHIVSAAKHDAREKQEGNLFLHPAHVWKIFRLPVLIVSANLLIRKYKIEIVSAQDPFEHGLVAMLARRGTGAKLHIQIHTDFLSPWFVKSGSWYMSLLNQRRCKIADQILPEAQGIRVVSERIRLSLITRYGARIPAPAVVPVAVDIAVPEPVPLPGHPFKFVLIAVGRLEAEKRTKDVLTAFSLVVTAYPMVGLFIVGGGRERSNLERMVRNRGLAEKVVFLGDRPDARALMPNAQAFIQASAYEGYGRTLIEAALANVPIVTTDVGIIGDVLKDGVGALVSPVADPTGLARNIMKLIEDAALRQELTAHAAVAVQEHITTTGNISERIYEDLARTLRRI